VVECTTPSVGCHVSIASASDSDGLAVPLRPSLMPVAPPAPPAACPHRPPLVRRHPDLLLSLTLVTAAPLTTPPPPAPSPPSSTLMSCRWPLYHAQPLPPSTTIGTAHSKGRPRRRAKGHAPTRPVAVKVLGKLKGIGELALSRRGYPVHK
jgi:hypothetical protein